MNTHKQKTILGLRWSLANQVINQSITFLVGILLVRLLTPNEFGLITMVTAITGFAGVLNEFGVGSALVQKRNIEQTDLSSVFWLNILISIVIAGVVFLSAKPISNFYDIPILEKITYFLSLPFLFSGLVTVQRSLLLRSMDFRRQFFINLAANIISGTLAIVLAYSGWGVWSLVAKSLVSSFLSTILFWVTGTWRPTYQLSEQSLKEVFSFSLPLMGTNSLNYWTRNLDNLLIGKFIGSEGLGYYGRAYGLMLLPVRQISGVISRVLFPSFSQIQDNPEQIKRIYLKITRVIAFITFPMMFGLSVVSNEFVLVVFGEQWSGMIPVLQILSILGATQSIGTLNGNIFLSRGATKLQFKVGIVARLFLIGSIVWGLRYGINEVALFYTGMSLLVMWPMYYIMGKLINLSILAIVRNLFRPFASSIIMVIVLLAFRYFIENISIPDAYILALSVLLGVLSYLLSSIVLNKKGLKEIILLVR